MNLSGASYLASSPDFFHCLTFYLSLFSMPRSLIRPSAPFIEHFFCILFPSSVSLLYAPSYSIICSSAHIFSVRLHFRFPAIQCAFFIFLCHLVYLSVCMCTYACPSIPQFIKVYVCLDAFMPADLDLCWSRHESVQTSVYQNVRELLAIRKKSGLPFIIHFNYFREHQIQYICTANITMNQW